MGKKRRRRDARERESDLTAIPSPRIPGRDTFTAGTPDTLLGLSTIYRCVALLTHTAAQLPLTQLRGGQSVPLSEWLRRPEAYGSGQRRRALVAGAVTSMATWGAAYWRAIPSGESTWTLDPVAPQRVTAQLDPAYRRTWAVDGRPVDEANGDARRPGLLVAPYLTVPGRAEPVGPLQRRRTSGGWLDTDEYATRIFRSGLHSGQRLETDQELPPSTAARYQRAWMEAHSDPGNVNIPVLGSGLRLVSDVIPPADAQWLEARTFNAQEQARLMGVPARMLGLSSGDSITYATARDNDNDFLRYTLMGYLDPIAEAWSSLLPAGRNADEYVHVKFAIDELLTPTTVDLWSALNSAVQAGWLSANEARARAGFDPIPVEPGPAPQPEPQPELELEPAAEDPVEEEAV